ncbi:hypothetical protein P3X46_002927 [Hevea brasiliensis]|uniref:EF-hand domain-containing protein n=1 Tax=Hevea brasiliensis TaxID=3981 RepID=A0ABQ9N4J5_HEVBR|nr:probable calcium-binding protein CML45 [Hevea brasiliensis]KAJ9187472.1 hypothetical protein P3X46_002927 [Hevea brasiliensis]
MEKVTSNAISTRLKFIHDGILNTLYGILSDVFLFYFQPLVNFIRSRLKASTKIAKEHQEKLLISGGDMKMVMDRLGIQQCDSDDDLQERYDARELSRLFEEHEPSLEEVKDAFDIFDENKDGFIDGKDLHRVLCCLGFINEGSKVDKCTEMISAVQKYGSDGKIDFNEFAIFMEKCFC